MNLGLGDVSIGQLVVSVWLVRSIPRNGLYGMIDVPMFEKLESCLNVYKPWYRCNYCFLQVKTCKPFHVWPHTTFFLHMLSSDHKST
jgi:hypothetical protein